MVWSFCDAEMTKRSSQHYLIKPLRVEQLKVGFKLADLRLKGFQIEYNSSWFSYFKEIRALNSLSEDSADHPRCSFRRSCLSTWHTHNQNPIYYAKSWTTLTFLLILVAQIVWNVMLTGCLSPFEQPLADTTSNRCPMLENQRFVTAAISFGVATT